MRGTQYFSCFTNLAASFNIASLARALYLNCILTNVSKSSDQSMEDYLQHIKILSDSLAVIQSLISDLELIQFMTSCLPPNYHGFATIYSMLPGRHTFDDLRSKLIFYKQWLRFQFNKEPPVLQARVSTLGTGSHNQGRGSQNQTSNANGQGKSNHGGHPNWNNKCGGCNNKGGNQNSNNNNSQQNDSTSKSMPISIVFDNLNVSSCHIYCTPILDTHSLPAGTN